MQVFKRFSRLFNALAVASAVGMTAGPASAGDWPWGAANETAPDWQAVLRHPGAHLHLYGKRHARAGRKMGHVTVCDTELTTALTIAMEIKTELTTK